jgi:hypothetical protein
LADKNIKITYEVDTIDLEKADALFKRISKSTDKADKEVEELGKDAKKAGTDTATSFKKASTEADKLSKNTKNANVAMTQLGGVAKKVGVGLAAAFTVQAAFALGRKIFDITAAFQKFEAVLTNTLGSQAQAQGAMLEIAAAASKTNFGVSELTDAYVKFANRGVKLSQAELLKLADIANSTGKSFDQLAEATLDAFSGENERLKEFGITAKKTGETTQFTFKGVTTEVQNTQEAVSKYLFSLAELNGVQGTTASISATLEGRVSNLGDAFDQLFLNIGKATTGVLPDLIAGFTSFINVIADSFKSLEQIKKEANALNLSGDLREDIDEVKALADQYVKSGRTIGEATEKAANDVIKSLDNILNGWEVLGAEEEANLKERIANLKKTFTEQKKSVDAEVGLLESLRKKLKQAQDDREKATTVKDINIQNRRIEGYQKEIDRLTKLAKAAEKVVVVLRSMNSLGFDEGAIKGIDTATKLYEKIYGEQIKSSNEVADVTEKNSERFIKGVEDQINATANKYNRELAEQARLEAEEKARYERRVQLVQDYTTAAQDLFGSMVAYQNQLDEQRVQKLTANRDKELASAGNNAKEKNRIELQYDAKLKEIRRKQAEREKKLAIFNAIINIAQGVTKAIAQGGVAGALLGALVAAAGAVQIATINSQQVPAYAKGTKSVPGKGQKDTEPAMLTPGEMVIPVSTKKKYNPILNAIFDHKLDPDILNNIASGKSGGTQVVINQDTKELVELLKNRPEYHAHLTEDGVELYMKKGNSRTKYLNKRYSAR